MAATNSTSNLGLPQWEATDKPERTDFNTAMSDIDNTVAAHLADNTTAHGIGDKADSGAGAVTTLTNLLNGWVGTVRVRKSDTGAVFLDLDVALGSTPPPLNNIVNIPTEFRPIREMTVPVIAPTTGAINHLYIASNGNLRTPASSTILASTAYQGVIGYVTA